MKPWVFATIWAVRGLDLHGKHWGFWARLRMVDGSLADMIKRFHFCYKSGDTIRKRGNQRRPVQKCNWFENLLHYLLNLSYVFYDGYWRNGGDPRLTFLHVRSLSLGLQKAVSDLL